MASRREQQSLLLQLCLEHSAHTGTRIPLPQTLAQASSHSKPPNRLPSTRVTPKSARQETRTMTPQPKLGKKGSEPRKKGWVAERGFQPSRKHLRSGLRGVGDSFGEQTHLLCSSPGHLSLVTDMVTSKFGLKILSYRVWPK